VIGIALVTEFRKLVSVKLWWILLVVLVLYTTPVAAFLTSVVSTSTRTPLDAHSAAGQLLIYNLVPGLGYVFPLVIGAVIATSEYSTGLAVVTFATQPWRIAVIFAKSIVAVLTGLAYGAIGSACCVIVAAPIFAQHGAVYLSDASTWWSLAGGVVAMGCWGGIGVGFGALVRNQLVAVVVLVGFTQFVEPIVRIVVGTISSSSDLLTHLLPAAASDALSGGSLISAAAGSGTWPQWAGATVLAGYVVVLSVAGGLATRIRDV